MTLTVSTLQELLESIASSNDGDSIVFSDNIIISESTEFSTNNNLVINLATCNLTLDAPLTLTSGNFIFQGGNIICNTSPAVVLDGADTQVTFGENLQAVGAGTVVSVTKKAVFVMDGATIGTDPESGEGAVVTVEGYTNANANSKLVLMSGSISAYGNYHGVDVSKKGIVEVHGGGIYSFSKAISKEDNTATVVTVNGGEFKGEIPEGSVDDTLYDISDPDANGVYTVSDKVDSDSESDSEVDSDIDSEVDPTPEPTKDADSDSDSEEVDAYTNEDSDVEQDPTPEPTPISESDSDSDVDPKPEPTPTPDSDSKTSVALTNVVRVFAIPSIKYPIDDIIGAITILDGEYTDPETNIVFKRVEYKLPGNGRKAVGYVFASTVTGA